MRIRLTKSDVIWSYLASIVSLLGSVVTMFMVLFFLDEQNVSLWYIFSSIGAMTILFDFGFSVTFARNVTYCWSGASELLRESVLRVRSEAEPNFELMKKVLSTCRAIYLILSLVVLFGCLTMGSGYIAWVSRGMDGVSHLFAWGIYAIAIFLNLYYGYFSSFLRGVGAVDSVNRNTVVAKISQIILMLFALLLGFGLIGASAAYLSYGLIFRILCKRDFYQYEGIGSHLSAIETNPSFDEMRELISVVWHNAWKEGLISLSGYICSQAGTLVASAFLSLAETGVYSLCLQMASMVATISGTLYIASEPSLQEAEASADDSRTVRLMGVIVTTTLLISVLLTILVIVIAPLFVKLIKPEYDIPAFLLLLLCAYQCMLKVRDCYATYFSCSNRVPYVWSYCLSSVVGVVLSAVLMRETSGNVYLFVLGQAVPQIAWNAWIWPLRAHREMGVSFSHLLSSGFVDLRRRVKSMLNV